MSREKTLLKNTFIYSVGNLSSKILVFILLPVYTYYLSTQDYGYFDLIITTVSLLVPLITLQIDEGTYRFLLEASTFQEKSEIVSSSILTIIINVLLFDSIFLVINSLIHFRLGLIICLYLNSLILFNFVMQISRGLRKNTVYASTGIITTFINLMANILLIVVFNFNVSGLIISIIMANLVGIMIVQLCINLISYLRPENIRKQTINKLIRYSIPLIPNLLNWWVMNLSDRYLINYFLGMGANGIYALSNKFPSILIVLNNIFYLAWQESAITESKSIDKNGFYSNVFNAFMRIQFSCLFVLLSLTPTIIFTFFNLNYKTSFLYIPCLYIAATFSAFSSFYGIGFQSSLETLKSLYSSIIGCIINFVGNLFLIPMIGIQGAALSTMMSFLAMWIIRVFQTKQYYSININKKEFMTFSALLFLFTFLYYFNTPIVVGSRIGISLVLFFIINRALILNLFRLTFNFQRRKS